MEGNLVWDVCLVMKALGDTKSRLEKERILKDIVGSPLEEPFCVLMDLALNPYRNYGVTKFPPHKFPGPILPSLDDIKHVRDELQHRRVTGNAAIELLSSLCATADSMVTDYLTRCFMKNPRIGLSASTLNKIWKGLIPEFKVGLCVKYDGTGVDWYKGWRMQPKYDGLRAITFVDMQGNIEIVSRRNKALFNTRIIIEEIRQLDLRGVVLDGEIMADDWNLTQSIARTQRDHDKIDELKYHIFDCVSYSMWERQTSIEWYKRDAEVTRIIKIAKELGLTHLVKVPSELIVTPESAQLCYDMYVNQGYEGAVFKDPSAQYPYGKGKQWWKWKGQIEADVEIIDYVEGTGDLVGSLGAFICDYKGTRVNVGGGFSRKQRDEFWENRQEMVGTIIEVKAQEETRAGSLRHCNFVRERWDK